MPTEYFDVTFKTPDTVGDTISDCFPVDDNDEDDDSPARKNLAAAKKVAEKFVEWGEYIRVRFYLDGRAEVLKT